jgi:hypothetical protein
VPHIKIPEVRYEGRRLGRHLETFDPRSLGYLAEGASQIVSVKHNAIGLPLNQGNLGSCTANALCGALNSEPNLRSINSPFTEPDAIILYERETADEGDPYPPNDPGGTGPAVCQAAKELGWLSSYRHALGLQAALQALVLRPVITGINWYTSFDTPDASGQVAIADGATVRGGHEVVADEIDAEHYLVWFWNSWGPDFGIGGRFCMSWHCWWRLLGEGGDVTVPIP